jgi:hypothetical protein
MAQAVTLRILTADIQVRARVSHVVFAEQKVA